MAALWWHGSSRNFIHLLETGALLPVWQGGPVLPALQTVIAQTMSDHLGFTGVRKSDLEVAGGKLDVWASIAYFSCPAAATDHMEVVMTAGDTGDDAKSVNDELVFMINELFNR